MKKIFVLLLFICTETLASGRGQGSSHDDPRSFLPGVRLNRAASLRLGLRPESARPRTAPAAARAVIAPQAAEPQQLPVVAHLTPADPVVLEQEPLLELPAQPPIQINLPNVALPQSAPRAQLAAAAACATGLPDEMLITIIQNAPSDFLRRLMNERIRLHSDVMTEKFKRPFTFNMNGTTERDLPGVVAFLRDHQHVPELGFRNMNQPLLLHALRQLHAEGFSFPTLHTLDLTHVPAQFDYMAALHRLGTMAPQLQGVVLGHLEGYTQERRRLTPAEFGLFRDFLMQRPRMRKLHFGSLYMGEGLWNIIEPALLQMQNLESLSFNGRLYNAPEEADIQALVGIIHRNPGLRALALPGCHGEIPDAQFPAIADAILDCSNLRSLKWDPRDRLTAAQLSAITSTLVHLQVLDLECLCSSALTGDMFLSLGQLTDLRELNIGGHAIQTDPKAAAFTTALSQLTRLEKLNISQYGYEINTHQLRNIFRTLAHLPSFHSLKFNNGRDAGVDLSVLASDMSQMRNLRSLSIMGHYYHSLGMPVFAAELAKMIALENLEIDALPDTALRTLSDTIVTLKNLRYVGLRDGCSQPVMTMLLEKLPRLQKFRACFWGETMIPPLNWRLIENDGYSFTLGRD